MCRNIYSKIDKNKEGNKEEEIDKETEGKEGEEGVIRMETRGKKNTESV